MGNAYENEGYENRQDYLRGLSEVYGLEYQTVQLLAEVLGPSEDFDGLLSALEDAVDMELV